LDPIEVNNLSKARKGWRIIGSRDLWKEAVDAVLKKNREVKVVLPYHQRPGATSWSDFMRLREDGQDVPLDLRDRTIVERGRLNKNPAEVKVLERSTAKLGVIMKEAMEHCQGCLHGGKTLSERDLCNWIETRAKEVHGAMRLSFPLIVSAGEHTAFPHHQPTDRRINKGELVLLDLGFYFDEGGYATDATRCFLGGKDAEATPGMKQIYTLVLRGFLKQWGCTFLELKLKAKGLDAMARSLFLEQAPPGFVFSHGTGHGLGISDHELGLTIGPSSAITLRENYVYSLEPGLYHDSTTGDPQEDFGVRIEDVVIVEKREGVLGHRSLCPMSLDERLIDRSRMDDSEVAILNLYLSKVP